MNPTSETLTADQTLVLQYLNQQPEQFIPEAEIARQADGQERFWEDPRWANHALAQLKEMNLVETGDGTGFRAKTNPGGNSPGVTNPVVMVAKPARKRFIAPHLQAILLNHGFGLNALHRE